MTADYTTADYTLAKLKMRQALPLDLKIKFSQSRIREWYNANGGEVYVSFSGGKDSTVLLDLVRSIYPHVPAVFVDTGLEYPEIRNFVKTFENVIWLKPKMPFNKVLEKYGYPVLSKKIAMGISRYRNTKSEVQKELRLNGGINPSSNKKQHRSIPLKYHYLVDAPFKISEQCCDVMKKRPFKQYFKDSGKLPYIGVMAGDSKNRQQSYVQRGCNAFEGNAQSRPMMFWQEDDIWEYIKTKDLPYSKIYDMGEKRTGCMFCMFGCQFEKGENRFQRMARTHPAQYKYCMDKLGLRKVLKHLKINVDPVELQTTLFSGC